MGPDQRSTPVRAARAGSGRRLRQADIARQAGVSQTTVSLVLSGHAAERKIAPQTQRKVLDMVQRLGYTVDPIGRRLAGGSNRLIGVFTFQPIFPRESRDFYHPFLVGVEEEAERLGYDLLLHTSATGPNGERSIYRAGVNRLRLADGAILLGLAMDRFDLRRLREDGFPFIHIGRRELARQSVPFVAGDYAQAVETVLEHLAGLGHRRIGYLIPDVDDEPTADRESGFYRAADRLGLTTGLARHHTPGALTTADVDWLRENGATAIVTHHTSDALAVRELLALRRVRIPDDCSLVALDEPPLQPIDGLSLAGIVIPRREMGSTAIRLLAHQLDGGATSPAQLCLPCRFVTGNSCAPPATTKDVHDATG